MKRYLKSVLVCVLIAVSSVLVGCDSILQVGIEPTATVTPVPFPTSTPPPSPRAYNSDDYGFAFEYPTTWTLFEEPQRIELARGTVVLGIGYRRADQQVSVLSRTGLPAGEVVYGGKIRFLGMTCPREVLQYENKDKAVFYNGLVPLMTAYGLEFSLTLEDTESDYMVLELSDEVQAEADQIVQSFVITDPTLAAPAAENGMTVPDEVVAARDAAAGYLAARYPEHTQLIDLEWSFQPDMSGVVGAASYRFEADGWLATITNSVVAPEYMVYRVAFESASLHFRWEGDVTPNGQVTDLAADAERQVVGWLGHVRGASEGLDGSDVVSFMPEGAGEAVLAGSTAEIESEIALLRDREGTGEFAHFWGTLICEGDQGCRLVVTRLVHGQMHTELEGGVDGWQGLLISNAPGAQFDDYFLLAGDYAVGYGIHAPDPEARQTLESLRDTGQPFRVWGGLRAGVPDAFGSQIEVERIEVLDDVEIDPYPGWGSWESSEHGFSFCYPPAWTLTESEGVVLESGGRLADAVTLTQDKYQITIQYKRMSDGESGWQGMSGPYALAVPSDKVTWLGQEIQRLTWAYDDETKVVELNLTANDRDLALMATLRDGTVDLPDNSQAERISKAAIQDLDRILGSFTYDEIE